MQECYIRKIFVIWPSNVVRGWSCWVRSFQLDLKNDVSLLFCVGLRFIFFSNFLFALLDQLKGLMFYFPCFLLSIFHANLVIRLELLPYIRNGSWYLSLWYSCEASYIPVCLFFSFSFSWKHATSNCWGFNRKEFDDFFFFFGKF